jgi:hypothetical protein
MVGLFEVFDRKRIWVWQERMTLKHKNTSRWAKRILKRGLKEHEDGSREAIAEQLRTHSMLTRKIQSAKMSSSSEESSSEEEGDEGDEGLAVGGKTRARLIAKAKMATVLALQGDGEAEIPTTGLFALPFMVNLQSLFCWIICYVNCMDVLRLESL